MTKLSDAIWLPLNEAATLLRLSLQRIRSNIKNGRLQRSVHFRRGKTGLELNIDEYRRWLTEESERLSGDRARSQRGDAKKGALPSPTLMNHGHQELAPTAPKRQPKLIPLEVWAEQMFGEHAPHRNTLLNWRRNAKIWPLPIKVGRKYFVSPDAEYVDPFIEKIQRMTGMS